MPCTIVTPLGEVAASSTNYYPFVTARVNLNCEVLHIDENECKFPEIRRRYGPDVRIHDPGYLGCVLLTSETDRVTAREIVEEFALERLDAYFGRAMANRHAPGHMEEL